MRFRVEQRLVLVLPVQVDEPGAEVAERGGRDERAVDERPAPALCGDLAPDQQFCPVVAVEDRLDDGAVLAGADEIGEARPPSRRPTASTRIDLPAPVSPVRTLRPASNSISAASMTARLRMDRNRSMLVPTRTG